MTVTVGEMHTSVIQDGAGRSEARPREATAQPLGVAEETWRETRRRVEYLAKRVCAENFDD